MRMDGVHPHRRGGVHMKMNSVIEQLKLDEGVKLKPYRDTAGKLTIGVGRNLDDAGISPTEADLCCKTTSGGGPIPEHASPVVENPGRHPSSGPREHGVQPPRAPAGFLQHALGNENRQLAKSQRRNAELRMGQGSGRPGQTPGRLNCRRHSMKILDSAEALRSRHARIPKGSSGRSPRTPGRGHAISDRNADAVGGEALSGPLDSGSHSALLRGMDSTCFVRYPSTWPEPLWCHLRSVRMIPRRTMVRLDPGSFYGCRSGFQLRFLHGRVSLAVWSVRTPFS